MSPFFANYGYNPELQFKKPRIPGEVAKDLRSQRLAQTFTDKVQERHGTLKQNLAEAQTHQTKYAKGKDIEFEVREKVWLSMRNIRTSRISKKLDYKRIGPYKILKKVNKNAYKLDLPETMKIHNVFHVSLLDKYRDLIPGQHPPEPMPVVTAQDAEEEWEVERILDSRRRYRKLQYLVQWAGYNHIQTSWEPAENLENAPDLIAEFHAKHPDKPR